MNNRIFDLETSLNSALEDDARRALKHLPKSTVVFCHLCHGLHHTLGALRLTKIWPRREFRSRLCDRIGFESKEHSKLFARHIRRVGREGALLDFLMRYLLKTSRARDEDDRGLKSASISFLHSPAAGEPLLYDKERHVVTLSDELYAALVPPALTERYWLALAQDDAQDGTWDDWKMRMMTTKLHAARGEALTILDATGTEASFARACALAKYYEGWPLEGVGHWTSDEEARLWYLLGALQTAYMLVHMHSGDDAPLCGFTSSGMIYSSKGEGTLSHCVGIMTASLVTEAECQETRRVLDDIQRTHAVHGAIHVQRKIDDVQFDRTLPQVKDVKRILKKEFDALAQAALVPEWPPKVGYWLANVIEWLRGSVHEGQGLSFCAVLGDYSRICDSGLFDVLTIDPNDHGGLPSPWDEDGTFLEEASREIERLVRQQMAKSNYSWFQEGRYALLWDASLPTRVPKALLALKGSSWDVFINESRVSRTPRAREEAALVVYVKSDGTGGVISKGRQIVTFRRNTSWQVGQTKLAEWVTPQIRKYVPWLGEGAVRGEVVERMVNTLVSAILAVSYDPHMGAMLVFMKDPVEAPPFVGMGALWRIRERTEGTSEFDSLATFDVSELVALMAMDGATCLYQEKRGGVRVAFGQLVGGEATSGKVRWGRNWDRLLRGEGSRKWNGAVTALRDDVSLVLAISQDGPIYRAGPYEPGMGDDAGEPDDREKCVQIQVSTEVMQRVNKDTDQTR